MIIIMGTLSLKSNTAVKTFSLPNKPMDFKSKMVYYNVKHLMTFFINIFTKKKLAFGG